MNAEKLNSLHKRNCRIIDAVIARAQSVCPGALDMIAVTGSFASGDFCEDSDLDLLIVIGDERGYTLAHGFILDGIGFDLYCQTWEALEDAAGYSSPYVSKLLDAQIAYVRDDAVRARFSSFGERLKDRLSAPMNEQDCDVIRGAVADAKLAYFDLAAEKGPSWLSRAAILYHTASAVYIGNHAVVMHGIRGMCRELFAMKDLPEEFESLYRALYDQETQDGYTETARKLIANTEVWAEKHFCRQPQETLDDIRGTYEEFISNYAGKMRWAVRENNRYVAALTAASAFLFLKEMKADGAAAIRALSSDDDSPDGLAGAYLRAADRYAEQYEVRRLRVVRYDDIDAFVRGYTGGGSHEKTE